MEKQSIGSCRESFNRFHTVIAGLACLAGVLSVGAEQVSSGLATRAVNTLIALSGQMDTPIKGTVASMRLCTATNGAAFYVAKLADGGFVVTSTDTEIDPIIAISSEPDLVEDPRNPLWSLLVSDMAARREAVASKGKPRACSTSTSSAGKAVTSVAAARWARLTSRDTGAAGASTGKSTISDVRVAPLLKTKWGQSYAGGKPCFNYYTPYGYVCGCTATAVAQLLRYHKFPTEYVEPDEYPCKIDWWDETLDQIGGWYDWDNMPEVPGRGTTDEQREAIGRLTYDVGLAVHSEYTRDSTTGYGDYVVDLLKKWGYEHATEYWFRSFHPFDYDGGPHEGFTEEEMKSVMIPNLDAKLPMGVRVYNKVTGPQDDDAHFVIADGYGYLNGQWSVHLNFGWDGNSDAWYVLPEFSADGCRYTAINRIYANIYPEGPSSAGIASGRVVSSTTSKPAAGIVVAARNGYGEVEYSTTDANGIYSFILPGLDGMVWNEDKWPDYDYDWYEDGYLDDDRYGNPDEDAGEPWEIYIENVNVASYSRNIRDGENHYGLDFAIPIRTVKLDATGGKVTPATIDVVEDGMYGELPMPSRKGYVFAGWWTQKNGGEHITWDKCFYADDFAGQKTPTIYAHWLQLRKLTLKEVKGAFLFAEWYLSPANFDEDPQLYSEIASSYFRMHPELEDEGYLAGNLDGKGVLEVLPGAQVYVEASEAIVDKNGNELTFQKWTVTPSKVDMGANFFASLSSTDLTMPDANVSLQPMYIDADACGSVYGIAGASSIDLGWDEEAEMEVTLYPPAGAFEWSPDGGKTWYKASSENYDAPGALLKEGKYTITWRSTDPRWITTTDKMSLNVRAYEQASISARFLYVPEITVDVMTIGGSSDEPSLAPGGTATMNPKDGLWFPKKAITLTAKAAKGYAFQGWIMVKNLEYLEYDGWFNKTSATWKLENYAHLNERYSYLTQYQYINPTDKKLHVVAVFKALSAYSEDDISFKGFQGCGTYNEVGDDGSVTIKAVVGCALDDDLALDCGPLASPLAYKLNGKLPDGLKFDAKKGVLSGVPKKAGNTSVTITATDPAKNTKNLTVYFEVSPLPDWLVGEFRGSMNKTNYTPRYWDEDEQTWVEGESLPDQQSGILELSVKSDGKVSAKLLTSVGSRSVSGTLSWFPDEDDAEAEGTFKFTAKYTKDDEECDVEFYPDGTIEGYADSYSKSEDTYLGGNVEGMRQDAKMLEQSPFLDKYYTFAFCATTRDDEDESEMQSGYGYLTLKTDKKGVAKVTGQLPDGEKVSMSALVLPFVDDESEALKARLYVFASPSSYKKQDWFAMSLVVSDDGTVMSEENAAWTIADISGGGGLCDPVDSISQTANVFGSGAVYSEAATLEDYYWNVVCAWSESVRQQYSWKQSYVDEDTGKEQSYTEYDAAYAYDFDGYFFNVAVMGDRKGAISLVGKSLAPWEESETYKEDGVTYTKKRWNCWEDKKGNPITDPSQLSISFTKATGIFTGKATVYFSYWQPNYKKNRYGEYEDVGSYQNKKASLPYSGVMIMGAEDYAGFGAAVYTYKYSYTENGKTKTDTEKISLPVSLAPADGE